MTYVRDRAAEQHKTLPYIQCKKPCVETGGPDDDVGDAVVIEVASRGDREPNVITSVKAGEHETISGIGGSGGVDDKPAECGDVEVGVKG